jgi:hypothetical protein
LNSIHLFSQIRKGKNKKWYIGGIFIKNYWQCSSLSERKEGNGIILGQLHNLQMFEFISFDLSIKITGHEGYNRQH